MLDRVLVLTSSLAVLLLAWGGAALAQTLDVPGAYPTIQAAIDAAPDGAVVQIAPGTYRERLEIRERGPALALRGDPNDPAQVVVDAGGNRVALTVMDVGDNVLIEGITFTGGTGIDGHGGGLYMARGAASFRRCVFRDNNASTDGGGAFVIDSAGHFEECEFRDNSAEHGGGLILHQRSTTVFDRCRFLGNRATKPGVAGVGGGFWVTNSSPTFLDCLVQGNHATGAGGGGVILSADWDEPERTTLLRGCTFTENSVDELAGSLRQGGGLHVEDNVRVKIVDGLFRGNAAAGGGGIANYRAALELDKTVIEDNQALAMGGDSHGGGLFVQSVNASPPERRAATLRLTDSMVRRNTASIGGGIFSQGDFVGGGGRSSIVVERSVIADNTATSQGGGIQADRTVATIRGSHVLRNHATLIGGGITGVFGSSIDITDTTLADNVTSTRGGAILSDRGGTLDVTDSRITGNRAGSAPAQGGGAIAIGETEGPVPGPITGQVTGSVIADNGDNYELWEVDCHSAHPSAVTFVGNTIHSSAGRVYTRYCDGSADSVAAFNALAGKASGNVDARPTFVSFLAAPSIIPAGGLSVLSWVAPAAASLGVSPGVGTVEAPLGTADVTPAATTTYTLDGPAIAPTDATVQVGCADLGMAVARDPGNGGVGAPGETRLRWFEAAGAMTYDVYLDRDQDPATLVGDDVADTALMVPDLGPDAAYRWRIVAKKPGCARPVSSPVFTFTTCSSAPCVTHDFGSRDIGPWKVIGRGRIEVVDGMLEVRGEPRVRAIAPGPAIGTGAVEVIVVPWRGRKLTLFIGYLDNGNTLELAVKGSGTWKMTERRRFGRRVLGRGSHPIAAHQPLAVRLELAGPEVVMYADGLEVMRGTADRAVLGGFGVGMKRGAVRIDDIRIERAGS
jgi:hypothetical protein